MQWKLYKFHVLILEFLKDYVILIWQVCYFSILLNLIGLNQKFLFAIQWVRPPKM
jgi:hypothetical protein